MYSIGGNPTIKEGRHVYTTWMSGYEHFLKANDEYCALLEWFEEKDVWISNWFISRPEELGDALSCKSKSKGSSKGSKASKVNAGRDREDKVKRTTANVGYLAAIKELTRRYGDPEVIVNSYVKKVMSWVPIRPNDPKALDEFSVYLTECKAATNCVGSLGVLEFSENLKHSMQKHKDGSSTTARRRNSGNDTISRNDTISLIQKKMELDGQLRREEIERKREEEERRRAEDRERDRRYEALQQQQLQQQQQQLYNSKYSNSNKIR
ncbi:uncharacterized protein LOC117107944 [Anneissia japonica]|uniref:uncharacterized protein LOC117107944 n=1 Tax=Anneissia japonica TaxID=1529436 RepID=UPI001425A5BC|nr:uncharacterized protein LOC117107944 [Anneissia japonica]